MLFWTLAKSSTSLPIDMYIANTKPMKIMKYIIKKYITDLADYKRCIIKSNEQTMAKTNIRYRYLD